MSYIRREQPGTASSSIRPLAATEHLTDKEFLDDLTNIFNNPSPNKTLIECIGLFILCEKNPDNFVYADLFYTPPYSGRLLELRFVDHPYKADEDRRKERALGIFKENDSAIKYPCLCFCYKDAFYDFADIRYFTEEQLKTYLDERLQDEQ